MTSHHAPDGNNPRQPSATPPAGPGKAVARVQPAMTRTAPHAGTTSAAGRLPVLVPFNAEPRPRFPSGQRIPVTHVPPHLLPPATAAARPPARPGNRRRVLIAVALAALMVLGLTIVTMVRTGTSPRDAVQDFFAALTAHDPTRLPIDPCRDNPLCQPQALAAGYQPPQDVTIGDDHGTDTDRQVDVSYTLDSRRSTTTVHLHGYNAGVLHGTDWSITEPPGAQIILPEQSPAPITIAATRLPSPTGGQPVSLWAPPGSYQLTRSATPLLEAAQTSLTITSGTPVTPTLPAVIRPAAADTTAQLVRDRIDACAAKPAFTPTLGRPEQAWNSCPMSYPGRYTITDSVTWTIQRYPQLHLEPAADGAITVTTVTPGTAAIRFRWTLQIVEPRTWTTVTDTVDIAVTGRVTAPNGTPEWQPG